MSSLSLFKKENWEFQANASWGMIFQICFVLFASVYIILSLNTKQGIFHGYDGLVLLLFLYINYVPRLKINLTYKQNNSNLDLLFFICITLEIILFIGNRKIEIGFHIIPDTQMWLETFVLSVIWISFGVMLSVKKGFLTFAGWQFIKQRALLLIIPILVMALLEEIFFRGLLFNYFKQISGSNVILAFTLSTLIFGLAHFKKRGWAMVLLSTLAGIFYCIVYIRTGSIYCATFIHFATNVCWLIFFRNNAPLQKKL